MSGAEHNAKNRTCRNSRRFGSRILRISSRFSANTSAAWKPEARKMKFVEVFAIFIKFASTPSRKCIQGNSSIEHMHKTTFTAGRTRCERLKYAARGVPKFRPWATQMPLKTLSFALDNTAETVGHRAATQVGRFILGGGQTWCKYGST